MLRHWELEIGVVGTKIIIIIIIMLYGDMGYEVLENIQVWLHKEKKMWGSFLASLTQIEIF